MLQWATLWAGQWVSQLAKDWEQKRGCYLDVSWECQMVARLDCHWACWKASGWGWHWEQHWGIQMVVMSENQRGLHSGTH